jgi:hypothetical protein
MMKRHKGGSKQEDGAIPGDHCLDTTMSKPEPTQ